MVEDFVGQARFDDLVMLEYVNLSSTSEDVS